MTHRWQLLVEITLDIKSGDTEEAGIERVKAALNKILGNDIAHYRFLTQPRIVTEFD